MKSRMASPRIVVGLVTFAVWAVAAGSALYWAMYAAGAQSRGVPPAAGTARSVVVDRQVVARALGATAPVGGATAAAPDVVSRLALRGVVTHDGRGAALIAVSGKPAKPFVLGAEVDSGWTLTSVSPRTAVLSNSGREASLHMPLPAASSPPANAATPASPAALPLIPTSPATSG